MWQYNPAIVHDEVAGTWQKIPDRRVMYVSDKYPWIVAAYRYHNKVNMHGEWDMVNLDMPAKVFTSLHMAVKGQHYIVHFSSVRSWGRPESETANVVSWFGCEYEVRVRLDCQFASTRVAPPGFLNSLSLSLSLSLSRTHTHTHTLLITQRSGTDYTYTDAIDINVLPTPVAPELMYGKTSGAWGWSKTDHCQVSVEAAAGCMCFGANCV